MADSSPIGALSADAFLNLFVTQLKHQDPTNPADPSQMMAQLAQLTTVQKLDAMATDFSSALKTERLGFARELIGSQIAWQEEGEVLSGVVNSAAVSQGETGVWVGDKFIKLDSVMEIAGALPA